MITPERLRDEAQKLRDTRLIGDIGPYEIETIFQALATLLECEAARLERPRD